MAVGLNDIILSDPISRVELAHHELAAKRHAAALRAANLLESLGLGFGPGTIAVRSTLPFNDLSLDGRTLGAGGADSRDQWVVPALTQGTNLAWINVAIPNNRVVVVYGCWYDTGLGEIVVARLEGGAGVKYEHQIEKTMVDQESVLIFPELSTWRPQETMIVRLVPRNTVAAGQRFGLLAVTAEGKGQRVNGDLSMTAG